MARKKKNWTMAEAVAWLRERVKAGETECADQDVICEQWCFSSGMRADIDNDNALTGFTIELDDVESWPDEEFVWWAEWGECRTKVHHGCDPMWTIDPPLDGSQDAALLAEYNQLANKYIELLRFDPSDAWSPECVDDLPCWYLKDAMCALGDVTFWADKKKGQLYVCRDEKEQKKVARKHANLRELDVEEAIDFVKTNYSDCFDWPYEAKVEEAKE